MKRIIAMVLVLSLLIVPFSFTASAAGSAEFTASVATAKVGDQVILTFKLSGAEACKKPSIAVSYDGDVFEHVSYAYGKTGATLETFDTSKNKGAQAFSSETDVNGDFFTLVLNVKALPTQNFVQTISAEVQLATGKTIYDTFSKSVSITISNPATAIAVSPKTANVAVGGTANLSAGLTPENATSGVTWTSSNTSVATVADGVVTGVAVGTATITATVEGTITDTAAITVVACLHTNTTPHEAVASTCKTQGHAAYTTCDDCGAVVSGDATPLALNPANHEGTPENVAAVPGTCHTKGTAAGTRCPGCGVILSGCTETDFDADNHDGGTTDTAAVASTCTTQGHAAYTTCNGCGAVISGSSTPLPLDENNHTGSTSNHPAEASTCSKQGHAAYTTCDACQKVIEGDSTPLPLDPTNHLNTENFAAVASTCKTQGHGAYTVCHDCEQVISGDATPLPLDTTKHTGEKISVPAKVATCVYTGNNAYSICADCGAVCEGSSDPTPIDPNNHVHKTSVPAKVATCVYGGHTAYEICNDCGAWIGFEPTEEDPQNHLGPIELVDAKEATKDEPGYTGDKVCKGCGEIVEKGQVIYFVEETAGEEPVKFDGDQPKALTFTINVPSGTNSLSGVRLVTKATATEPAKEIEVPEDEYTFEDGVLTIKDSFLKTLGDGEYTVRATITTTDDTAPDSVTTAVIEAPLTVKAATPVETPKNDRNTGDTAASLMLWSVVALVSLAGATVMGVKIKRSIGR